MNPILQMLTGNSNGTNIMFQAFGSMMRGESPIDFMKNLAKTEPKLQGLDFNNIEATAKDLCEKNNIDMNALAQKISEFANSNIKS